MIRIIREGKIRTEKHRVRCKECSCIFEYGKEDVQTGHDTEDNYEAVKCPFCGYWIDVKEK